MTNSPLLTLSAYAHASEPEMVQALLAHAQIIQSVHSQAVHQAREWVQKIRQSSTLEGVEAYLKTYGLNTEEGAALMCMAEALLRIPDAHTADQLIHDTISGKHWEKYIGHTHSWTMAAASWGLALTGKIADFGEDTRSGIMHHVKNMVSRLGEPVIREALKKAMRMMGAQFVLAETIEEALHIKPSERSRFSYDILGEGARTQAQADAYLQAYKHAIIAIGKTVPDNISLLDGPGMSVKLSALHPRYQLIKKERICAELLPRLKELLLLAKEHRIAISLDAEEASRFDLQMQLLEALFHDEDFKHWNGIGVVLQAYQKRAFYAVDWLQEQARASNRQIPLRLVKGAYWDFEIKFAQQSGLPQYPVFTRKEHTDVSYLACADKILSHADMFYPQFATHNAHTAASVFALTQKYALAPHQFEFQRLHGMGEALHAELTKHAPSRTYAPIGAHKDLLAYLIRRLLENGANTSFVHILLDEHVSIEQALADPIAKAHANKGSANPHIPLPVNLYGVERKNSTGVDFGNVSALHAFQENVSKAPSYTNTLPELSVNTAAHQVQAAFLQWSESSVYARAELLEKVADTIEAHAAELINLCVEEAKKTLPDSVAEVREAADFCRYYAAQARALFAPKELKGPTGERNTLSLHARGVFACISPWNFPLAIFTGQIAAALATGNCVIAKPAEQTPRIAVRAVELFHQAGIPAHVLQIVIGTGEKIGAALTRHPAISGVVFTGGTDTAHIIHQSLANRKGEIIPLIAETGGQNCMVVDSSALLEQAVDDIIASAFGSAGQRCSALRVLYVQEDIADALIALLKGALVELSVNNPALLATDIGPVIDNQAHAGLTAHIERMKKEARLLAVAPVQGEEECFIAPHIFELQSIQQLEQEIFGPILHLIRYQAKDRDKVVEAINSTGYGLTFGIHSRIQDNIEYFTSSIHAGNLYINRSMIGATVGVQPFGGEGLSGTGFKAGGPHYLLRLTVERHTANNIAAIGGNVALLAGE